MARPISEEELQLKKRARRRLVGAIVLVSAVAVILPMVLDSEPRPVTQNVDIQIPSPDSGEFKPKPVSPSSAASSASAAPIKGMPPAPGSAKDTPPKVDTPAQAAAKAAADDKDSSKDEKAAAKATATDGAAANGAYVVQVAALADAARVKQLQKQMSAAGIRSYTEAVNAKTGEMTRVRAGPYATREAAENARNQLKKAGLDGKVVPK